MLNLRLKIEDLNNHKILLEKMPTEDKEEIVSTLYYFLKEVLPKMEKLALTDEEAENFSVPGYLNSLITNITNGLNKQIDIIIHHPKFLDLEGKLRGIEYIVSKTELGENMQIRVASISDKELKKDLSINDWDQSKLFKQLYESEIGTYGGNPFSLLIYDHLFSSSMLHIDLLNRLSSVCSAAHISCLSAVDSSMFNIEDYSKINNVRDLKKTMATKVAWNSFREKEDSRYMNLTLPRFMGRAPYCTINNPADDIDYTETVDGSTSKDFVWCNSAYALALAIHNAHCLYGWCASIRGVESGGSVEDLPVFMHLREQGDVVMKCPLEVALGDRKEKEIADLGFIPLCHCKGTNKAVFFSTQTCQKPQLYVNDAATANAKMSSALQYMLVANRFAHYQVVMIRTKIGSFQRAEDFQIYLQNWLNEYVLPGGQGDQEMKAKMPLLEGKVIVQPSKSDVGKYNAIMYITPHFQLDEISVSLRMVSRMPG